MSRLPEITNPQRQPHVSDLSDAEWNVIKPLLPAPKGFGHPRTVDLREILNGIFYVRRTGCQWEMLPHDLPPYSTVYSYFRKWQRKGILSEIHDKLRRQLRTKLGRDEDSTVAIADSQSVKTTEKADATPRRFAVIGNVHQARGMCTDTTVAKRSKGVSAS